ncbi:DUF3992 domain-containing protein [Bacillus sp. MRMR6]|uniref:DUF3992 domain-containing protein n=1 Tax=Bacillus sp. MRMR6 TaxID=1928617 RepID=UPI00095283B0|nr:DUF3992 domain-containing protein [Bacillus sp. MRMR6]OLS33859.1 hypothetical protein BTR25_23640 [Bacillus sp. MRMR6]
MIEKPIFPYSSEFISDDDSNFLGEYAGALIAVQNYYNNYVTTGSVALIQASVFEYLFLVDQHDGKSDVLKVKISDGVVELVSQFDKLKLRNE